jgi:hypothetical protein
MGRRIAIVVVVIALVAVGEWFVLHRNGGRDDRTPPQGTHGTAGPSPQASQGPATDGDDEDFPGPPPDLPICPFRGATFGTVESYDAETLSEKIDGRADFYLSSGFVGLRCVRFRVGDDAPWLEACDYDMGTLRNAYSVFSRQRRPAWDDDHDDDVNHTQDGIYWVSGHHYVALPFPPDQRRNALTHRECYRHWRPNLSPELPETAMLPREGRRPDSLALAESAAFGYDRLDTTLHARYRLPGGGEALGFVSLRADAAEAQDLARGFAEFLLQDEGTDGGEAATVPGGRVVDNLGAWTVVFTLGPIVAGVHDAPTRAGAEALAGAIRDAAAAALPR